MRFVFLVVDASDVERELTVSGLRAMAPSAEVLEASSAEGAIALLEERRVVPSLAFVEQSLPGMSGLEMLAEVRDRRWLEEMPVALLTRSVADRLVVSAYRLGARAFLAKPVRAFELRECVRDWGCPAVEMAAGRVVTGGSGPARITAA